MALIPHRIIYVIDHVYIVTRSTDDLINACAAIQLVVARIAGEGTGSSVTPSSLSTRLADTRGAAWAMAHFGGGGVSTAPRLAALPIAALRLENKTGW